MPFNDSRVIYIADCSILSAGCLRAFSFSTFHASAQTPIDHWVKKMAFFPTDEPPKIRKSIFKVSISSTIRYAPRYCNIIVSVLGPWTFLRTSS